jgi:hypothetical protein
MEEYSQFVDWRVPNDERAPKIASSLVTIVPTSPAENYLVIAVCIDNASNELSMLNELHSSSLPSQAELPVIRIPCIAYIADLGLGGLLAESKGAKLCDIQKILAAFPDYNGATFSDISKL